MITPKSIVSVAFLCLCLSVFRSHAQGKAKHTLGKLTPADFVLPATNIIDSNTNAVVLADLGDVFFVGNSHSWFSHVYVRQTRIKILNKKALDLAKVSIDLYGKSKEDMEQLTNVQASSYTLVNGQMQETKMDAKDIYSTRTSKDWTETKFSVPGVKEGSILEYTYTITSTYNFNLPAWHFQSIDNPCLSSEYHVEIPQTLNYVVLKQGVHAYAVDKGTTGNAIYSVEEKADRSSSYGAQDEKLFVHAVTAKHDWVMKDIPAFGTESYLTTPKNYIDKITLQLSGTYNGEDRAEHMNTWAKATEELLTENWFGGALDQSSNEIGELADKIPDEGDLLNKARTVYYYITRHFTCTNHYDFNVRTDLQDVIHKNSGDVGEINLLLVGLLRHKGIHADPVLLSTRDFGFNVASYPMIDKLNYAVVRTEIDGHVYYLDAAQRQLGFGTLAANCYNGHARIISKTDSGSVYFWADSLRESRYTMVLMAATDKGIAGSYQSTLGKERSYDVRRFVGEHDEKQYFKDIQTNWGEDAEISNGGIDSVDQLEEPVKVHYDILLKQPVGAPVLYLNPMMGDDLRYNPFTAAERKYPVEMYYTFDQTYVFSLMIPDGYVVDELPRSARVVFNGDQGNFEYLIVNQDDQVQLRCRVRLNKAWFGPEDYASLRDFFAYVVKKENEQIVLKKK